jgi:aromatic-amino-acid transaminase
VANSYSKNFSLYGERCGGLHVICESAIEAERALGQLTSSVRSNYSNPPTHGAKIVTRVLTTPELTLVWQSELSAMCQRIARMRVAIHDGLLEHVRGETLSRYIKQRGMFTYTGLTADQVERLREAHGVYILRSGRMCVAGLNEKNVGPVTEAIAKVLASGA